MEFNENVIYEPDCFAIQGGCRHIQTMDIMQPEKRQTVWKAVFSPASMADGNLHMPIT